MNAGVMMSDRADHFEDVTVDSARFQALRAGAPLALQLEGARRAPLPY